MKKGIQKSKNKYLSPYYLLFHTQNEKAAIQNDLPKVTKSSAFANCLKKQWSKILNYVYCIMF